MRLFLGLALVWGCSNTPQPVPAQIKPIEPDRKPQIRAGKVLQDKVFSALGMIQIPSGTVTMGPRHGPMLTPHLNTNGSRRPTPMPDQPTESSPWMSVAGRGLMPRNVTMSTFLIDQTEVTQGAYAKFLEATGYRIPHVAEAWADDGWNWESTERPAEMVAHPVVMVSFYDAQAYCVFQGKRLPTEAEWQMAALGPAVAQRMFPWGGRYRQEHLNHGQISPPNFDDTDGFARTSPVGSFPSGRSVFGLDDTFGNAWEYTADLRIDDWTWAKHDGFGPNGAMLNARSPGPGLRVAVRGGSFYFDFRPNPGGEWNAFVPESRRKSAGFRCAADLNQG